MNGSALIGKRTAEKRCDNVNHAGRHVVLQSRIGVLAVVRRRSHQCHIYEEVALEQRPNVARRVDLLHFDFRVDVAVVEKIDVNLFHLSN